MRVSFPNGSRISPLGFGQLNRNAGNMNMAKAVRRVGRPQDQALIERRKEEILVTAARIFAERGYRNTDVQAIADVLGVGKGTVYRYFPSKRELFFGSVDRAMKLFLETLAREADKSTDPLQRIANVVHAYLGYFENYPEVVELLIQERAEFRDREKHSYFLYCETRRDKWHEAFRNLVLKDIARDIPVERMFDIISNLLYGTMFTNFFSGDAHSLQQQAEDILDVFFNGILKVRSWEKETTRAPTP